MTQSNGATEPGSQTEDLTNTATDGGARQDGSAGAAPAAGASAPLSGDGNSPGATGDGGSADSSPKPVAPQRQPKADWRDRRIAQLTAQLAQARQAPKTTAPAAPGGDPAPAAGGLSDADVERRAAELAAELAAVNEFNRRCDEAQQAGRAAFGDFDSRVAGIRQLVDPQNQQEVFGYNQLLDAAIQTGQGPALIHALGGDLDEAQRLMSMSPTRMAVELTKMASKIEPTAGAPSGDDDGGVRAARLPAPLRVTAGARGPTHEKIEPDDPAREDRLSVEEWMRRRNAQVAERRAGNRGLR